ncbi:MAG: hypothetical protein N3G21_13185, partial [Candidatus Hydrogenedentes bacterium]|nr:hypothetical protein [Candidatus Hydrogenedentota bacterium]
FPNDPLTYWLLARVYEKLNDVSKADWFWRKVFICSPILPLGWHLLYDPCVRTLDLEGLTICERRESNLGIVIDNIKDEIRWFIK